MSTITLITKVTKHTVKSYEYPRIQLSKHLNEINFKPGDEIVVEIDKDKETITIRRK